MTTRMVKTDGVDGDDDEIDTHDKDDEMTRLMTTTMMRRRRR